MDEIVGDGKLKLFVSFARPLITKLKEENEKDLATRWISRIVAEADASLKEQFITFLTYQLTTNNLYGIFLREPPSNDDSLPSLPPDFDEIKMYEYVCEKSATNQDSLPEIRTLSSDEQTFQAMQIVPGSGLRVYTVVSDEPYSMWPKPPDTIPPLATLSSSSEQLHTLTEFIESEAGELRRDSANVAREIENSQMTEHTGMENSTCAIDEHSTVRDTSNNNRTAATPQITPRYDDETSDICDLSVVDNKSDLNEEKSIDNNESGLNADNSVVNNESGLNADFNNSKCDANTSRYGKLYSMENLLREVMSASSLPVGKRATSEKAKQIYIREKNLPPDFQPSWEYSVRNPFIKFLRYYIFGKDGPALEAEVTKEMRKNALRSERRDYYKEGVIHPHLATLYEIVEKKKKMIFSKSSQEDVDDFLDFIQHIPGDDITPLLRQIKEPKPTQSKDIMERMGHFTKREQKFKRMRQRTRLYMQRNSMTGETRVAHFSDTYADSRDISSDESEYDYKNENPFSFTRRNGELMSDDSEDEEESHDCDDNARNGSQPKLKSSASSIPLRSQLTENIRKDSDSHFKDVNNISTNGCCSQDLTQGTNTRQNNSACPRVPECRVSWYDREEPPLDFEMPNFETSMLKDREKIRESLHFYDANMPRVDRLGRPIVSKETCDTAARDTPQSNRSRKIPSHVSNSNNKLHSRAITTHLFPTPIRDPCHTKNTRCDYAQSTPNEKYANRVMDPPKFYKSRDASLCDLIADEPYPEDFFDLPDSSNSRSGSFLSKGYSSDSFLDKEASCPKNCFDMPRHSNLGRSSGSLNKRYSHSLSDKESNNYYDMAGTSRKSSMSRYSQNSRCPRSKSFASSSRDSTNKDLGYPSLDDSRDNLFDEKFPDIPDIGSISGEFGSLRNLSRTCNPHSRSARSLSVPNLRGTPDAQLRRNSVFDLKTRYEDFMSQIEKVASTKFR